MRFVAQRILLVLEDFAYPEEAIKAALERLPKVG